MTTRPTDAPADWDASGNTSAPAAGQITSGWVAGQRPPAEEVNFQWASWADWLQHFASTASKFVTPESTKGVLSAGDTFILDETDGTEIPGGNLGGSAASSARDVDVSGWEIVTTHADTNVRLMSRDLGTVIDDEPLTNAGTPVRVKTNGVLAWVAYGQYLEQFSGVETGALTSDWVYDHGAAINDIDIDNGRVYLVGVAGTGGNQVRAISQGTGAALWSGIHGATLWSVCTDGYRVFIGGVATGGASLANVRGIMASNGEDATGEIIGAGNAEAWDLVLGTDIPNRKAMACDDDRLFIARAGGNEVLSRSKPTGGARSSNGQLTAVSFINVDHEYVYALTSTTVTALTKDNLSKRWTSSITGGAPVGLASDGSHVYAARSGANDVIRLTRGNNPGLWQVAVLTDYTLPRQRVIPAARY